MWHNDRRKKILKTCCLFCCCCCLFVFFLFKMRWLLKCFLSQLCLSLRLFSVQNDFNKDAIVSFIFFEDWCTDNLVDCWGLKCCPTGSSVVTQSYYIYFFTLFHKWSFLCRKKKPTDFQCFFVAYFRHLKLTSSNTHLL